MSGGNKIKRAVLLCLFLLLLLFGCRKEQGEGSSKERPPVDPSLFYKSIKDPSDRQLTKETLSLYHYLHGISGTYLLFGQENTNFQSIVTKKGISCDPYHLTGAYPAVFGFDYYDTAEKEVLQQHIREAYALGGIITVSIHMPNLTSKGNCNDLTPTLPHLLAGGRDHQRFIGELEQIGEFFSGCRDVDGNIIPVIFRPYHENEGNWFWWGSMISPEEFKELWITTVHYLREVKGLHNLLYAYSPNGHFETEEAYLMRYPGDEYVDILGFDIYQDGPEYDPDWLKKTRRDADIVAALGIKRGKISAVTEIGLRHDGVNGLKIKGNEKPDWFMDIYKMLRSGGAAERISYFMAWRNEDQKHFFVPYDDGRGGRHEMADSFVEFYNQAEVIFSNRLGDVYGWYDPTKIK